MPLLHKFVLQLLCKETVIVLATISILHQRYLSFDIIFELFLHVLVAQLRFFLDRFDNFLVVWLNLQ